MEQNDRTIVCSGHISVLKMNILATSLLLLSTLCMSLAFTRTSIPSSIPRRTSILNAVVDRRVFVGTTIGGLATSTGLRPAYSDDSSSGIKKIAVAGSTGQTGRRIIEKLCRAGNSEVIAGVRDLEKGKKSLGESNVVVRGAMVQTVPSVDASTISLAHLDVVKDSVNELAAQLAGANVLLIATGFVPGNPLKMNAAAHEVDNVGTIKLIDAAKATKTINKVVMVSSILTNGRNWGQEKSPGFVITNAFGNVLDEKLVAENYLKASGLDYTIVRPGGLKSQPATGDLIISPEDTLNSGEISRDLVADVVVASVYDKKASNKVLEIIEDDGSAPTAFNGLKM